MNPTVPAHGLFPREFWSECPAHPAPPAAGRDPSPSLASSPTPSTAHLALQLVMGVRSVQSRDMFKFTSMCRERSRDWQACDTVRMDGRMGGWVDETASEDGTSYFGSAVSAEDLVADTMAAAPGIQPDSSWAPPPGSAGHTGLPRQGRCVQEPCSAFPPRTILRWVLLIPPLCRWGN